MTEIITQRMAEASEEFSSDRGIGRRDIMFPLTANHNSVLNECSAWLEICQITC